MGFGTSATALLGEQRNLGLCRLDDPKASLIREDHHLSALTRQHLSCEANATDEVGSEVGLLSQ